MNDAFAIKHRFSKSARTYQDQADIQRQVAQSLASYIDGQPKKILEIGCGTGLLTTQLIKRFPLAQLTATDMSREMLDRAQTNITKDGQSLGIRFELLNPEKDSIQESFDLIVASMVVHWFQEPVETIKRICNALDHNGRFYFSTIGPDCFGEWQQVLKSHELPIGLRIPPQLPGLFEQDYKPVTYPSAQDFLHHLKATGTNRPRLDYTPLSLTQLKRAMVGLEQQSGTTLTWHIQYGRLNAQTA